MIYKAVDFDRIHREGFEYAMPAEANDAIHRIAATVGAETYCPTPVFPKRNKPVHEKTGDVKRLAEFQSHLNKLSEDTYISLEPKLLAALQDLDSTNLQSAAETLLRVANENPFFGMLYAKLFIKCAATWPEFKAQFDTQFLAYTACLEAGKCGVRAQTQFLIHLNRRNWLPKPICVKLLETCQGMVETNLRCADKTAEVEEWAEHVFLFAMGNIRIERSRLKAVAALKPGCGISLKALFRYMDLMDQL